jgi:hypothetical protein
MGTANTASAFEREAEAIIQLAETELRLARVDNEIQHSACGTCRSFMAQIGEASFGMETSNGPAQARRWHMSTKQSNGKPLIEDIHAFLEKTLIEAFLKGKGYTLEDLQNLPEEEAKQIMKGASTYASGKLAEVEVKAHFMQELHDAYIGG